MSAIAGLVPKIEGFQPIPNAVMIPFMETQSAALAFGFGLNYEYGKRTIRSMSNETFNSLTSQQIAEMSAQHSTVLLNRFIQAVPQVMPAQQQIFQQYVAIEKLKVVQNVELAKWIAQNAIDIVAKGTTGPNIKVPIPSDVTSRVDDGTKITTTYRDGRVEVTYHPKDISIELKEELKVKETTEPPPPPTVVNINPKLVAHYENNIKVLELKLKQVIIKERNATTHGGKIGLKQTITIINREIAQQRRFLANVKRGQDPY